MPEKPLKRHPRPFLTLLIARLAKRMGATVILEPEFGYVGQIVFRNGKKTFFRNRVLSINRVSSVEVSRDKNYTTFFLKTFGYNVPEERTFFSDAWCKKVGSDRGLKAAAAYARRIGYPVIVKPNGRSQGAGVVKARTEKELLAAAKDILKGDHLFLVQRFVAGRDYRVVVLDGKVLSAYERMPLAVTGDGKSTVQALLERKQQGFERDGRDTRIRLDDKRMLWTLKAQKLTMRSVPGKGLHVALLDNANLSTGGESTDVTETMHEDYRRLAINVTRDMGLRLCGVDLLCPDICAPLSPAHVVLETNAAPGLDHYASTGKRQMKIVEDLYLQVLRAIERE